MPAILLKVTHQKQRRPSDCLAACAAMVLDALLRPEPYDNLVGLLDIVPDIGAPASNILRLSNLVSGVVYASGSLDDITQYLKENLPCIAFVHTLKLGYWIENTRHAVVVMGIDETSEQVYLDDPFFDTAPQVVSYLEFQLAWEEMGNLYAVLIP